MSVASLTARLPLSRTPGLRNFGIVFSKHNVPPNLVRQKLNDPDNVLKERFQDVWASREKDCLWWFVSSQTLKTKRAIRCHCARRLRVAIKETLKLHGYDEKGCDLRGRQYGALVGSIEIHPFISLLETSHEDVLKEADALVYWLKENCSGAGQPKSSGRTKPSRKPNARN